ncbi:hypothetical protein EUX98_g9506, partial [Antrodiella citrinella]
QLYRREEFRGDVIAILVDESHVIPVWGKEFRKDYNELNTLRITSGTEIPWGAFSATVTTDAFEFIYRTARLGQDRPFWGIDNGFHRPNLQQHIRPMEYPLKSFVDLYAFVPETPHSPTDFPKSIFYFASRRAARSACSILRKLIPPDLRHCFYTFTAVHSQEYKERVMKEFREGLIRYLFCTDAAGMGTDVPDIIWSVIYGVTDLPRALQQGGRAGRQSGLKASMVWLIEPWVFSPFSAADTTNSARKSESLKSTQTKKALTDEERRQSLDCEVREYIACAQGNRCMREFAATHFRPQPNLPGFPAYSKSLGHHGQARGEDISNVEWEVVEQDVIPAAGVCCSARICRSDPDQPIGPLTTELRALITHHLTAFNPMHPASESAPAAATLPSMRCSMPERVILRDVVTSWRDERWKAIRARNPFLCRDWIITEPNINRLVDKAHLVLGAVELTVELIQHITSSKWIADDDTINSLILVLEEFRAAQRQRLEENRKSKPTKKLHSQDTATVPSQASTQSTAVELFSQEDYQMHDTQPSYYSQPSQGPFYGYVSLLLHRNFLPLSTE